MGPQGKTPGMQLGITKEEFLQNRLNPGWQEPIKKLIFMSNKTLPKLALQLHLTRTNGENCWISGTKLVGLLYNQRNLKTTHRDPKAYTLKKALHPPPHQEQVGGRELLLLRVLFGQSRWTWQMLPPVGESQEVFDHSLLRSGASVRTGRHDTRREKPRQQRTSLFSTHSCCSVIQLWPLFALHAEDQKLGFQEAGPQPPADADSTCPSALRESYMASSGMARAGGETGPPQRLSGLLEAGRNPSHWEDGPNQRA